MKKFSKILGIKVASEPKNIVKEEAIDIRYKIMELIDNTISIKTYGPGGNSILMTTKIEGKEMLVDCLLNLMSDKSAKEQVKALESLKECISDWKSIDEKIDTVKLVIENTTSLIDNENEVKRVLKLVNRMSSDTIDLVIENNISKISNLELRKEIIMLMINSKNYEHITESLTLIYNKYNNKP